MGRRGDAQERGELVVPQDFPVAPCDQELTVEDRGSGVGGAAAVVCCTAHCPLGHPPHARSSGNNDCPQDSEGGHRETCRAPVLTTGRTAGALRVDLMARRGPWSSGRRGSAVVVVGGGRFARKGGAFEPCFQDQAFASWRVDTIPRGGAGLAQGLGIMLGGVLGGGGQKKGCVPKIDLQVRAPFHFVHEEKVSDVGGGAGSAQIPGAQFNPRPRPPPPVSLSKGPSGTSSGATGILRAVIRGSDRFLVPLFRGDRGSQ